MIQGFYEDMVESILREKAMTLPEFDRAEIREFVDVLYRILIQFNG